MGAIYITYTYATISNITIYLFAGLIQLKFWKERIISGRKTKHMYL